MMKAVDIQTVNKMTKSDLVAQLCKDAGITRQQASDSVDSVFNSIKKALSNGDDFQLRNFGTFKMKHYAAKKARNIHDGTTITVPECDKPSFSPSKNFLDII